MNIELKNFKHFAAGSEETEAFTATVYVDGVRTFYASNSGKGEANRFDPVKGRTYADIKKVEDWVSEQPDIYYEDHDESLNDNLDFYISRLVGRELTKRDLKKLIKRRIVVCEPDSEQNSASLFSLSSKYTPHLLSSLRKKLNAVYPECLILNDLEFEQALDIYAASNSPKQMADIYQQIKAAA